MVVPELDTVARARLVAGVPNNMGRTLTGCFFQMGLKVIDNCPLTGDGYQAFKTAREHGQPVILVAGHLGTMTQFAVNWCAKAIQLAACINDEEPIF